MDINGKGHGYGVKESAAPRIDAAAEETPSGAIPNPAPAVPFRRSPTSEPASPESWGHPESSQSWGDGSPSADGKLAQRSFDELLPEPRPPSHALASASGFRRRGGADQQQESQDLLRLKMSGSFKPARKNWLGQTMMPTVSLPATPEGKFAEIQPAAELEQMSPLDLAAGESVEQAADVVEQVAATLPADQANKLMDALEVLRKAAVKPAEGPSPRSVARPASMPTHLRSLGAPSGDQRSGRWSQASDGSEGSRPMSSRSSPLPQDDLDS